MTVHAFEPRRPVPNRAKRPAAGTATIIIFPGVRYERRDSERKDAVEPAPREKVADATS